MMAKTYQFPIEGTKFDAWAREAYRVKQETNLVGARIYVMKSVPLKFREQVIKLVKEMK